MQLVVSFFSKDFIYFLRTIFLKIFRLLKNDFVIFFINFFFFRIISVRELKDSKFFRRSPFALKIIDLFSYRKCSYNVRIYEIHN